MLTIIFQIIFLCYSLLYSARMLPYTLVYLGERNSYYAILFYSAFCSATHARNHYIPNLFWVLLHTH